MSVGTRYEHGSGRRIEQGEYYALPRARVEEIAKGAGLDYYAVARIALGQDWAEGAEHQKWLDHAPKDEIAGWVKAILADELQGEEHEENQAQD